jgi:hypothetical protein
MDVQFFWLPERNSPGRILLDGNRKYLTLFVCLFGWLVGVKDITSEPLERFQLCTEIRANTRDRKVGSVGNTTDFLGDVHPALVARQQLSRTYFFVFSLTLSGKKRVIIYFDHTRFFQHLSRPSDTIPSESVTI